MVPRVKQKSELFSLPFGRQLKAFDVLACSLAALLAVELQADLLMLMTDVDGLYTGPPNEPASEIISTYCPQVHDRLIKFGIKSDGGRGGMIAKASLRLAFDQALLL